MLEGYFDKSGFDSPCLHRESQRELYNVLKKRAKEMVGREGPTV